MGKGKLAKFAEMETFNNVFQYPYSVIDNVPFEMKAGVDCFTDDGEIVYAAARVNML